MSNTHFPALASPVDFGPMRLRNRIALLPHGLFFADRDQLLPTERHRDYYRARARGGVGLVCVESSVVSLDGRFGSPTILSSDSRCIEGYRRIADAVHEEGARISGQMTHYGNQASVAVTRRPLIGPSTLPNPALGEPARAMTYRDMVRVRHDFVSAARNFEAAGFDAVELKVAHDGLLQQFLSPLTNDRQDEYGGSILNRLRYVMEIASDIKSVIGDKMALGVRLVVDECIPGGYGLDEGLAFAEELGGSHLFHFMTSDVGVWASMDKAAPPMPVPEGFSEQAFSKLTEVSDLPVIAFGRIRTPEYAEKVVKNGHAAAIGMARELITDPDFAEKAFSGRRSQIRPCTGCNQLCIGNGMRGVAVSCTVNPSVGFGERLPIRSSSKCRKIVIVGGGPAGLEYARLAAEKGHEVTLFEQEKRLGGQLAVAAQTGRRSGWGEYLSWLRTELERLGVDLRLQTRADVSLIKELNPGNVILACGSSALPSALDTGGNNVRSLDDYLANRTDAVCIAFAEEGSGGLPLWTGALEAAQRGAREISLVSPKPMIGEAIDPPTFLYLYRELHRNNVRLVTDHVATSFDGNSLNCKHLFKNERLSIKADLVVAATRRETISSALESELRHQGFNTTTIGDAVAPRDAVAAIREGQLAGMDA